MLEPMRNGQCTGSKARPGSLALLLANCSLPPCLSALLKYALNMLNRNSPAAGVASLADTYGIPSRNQTKEKMPGHCKRSGP
jgi:hypothetical protein